MVMVMERRKKKIKQDYGVRYEPICKGDEVEARKKECYRLAPATLRIWFWAAEKWGATPPKWVGEKGRVINVPTQKS